jgi:UMP-CMP kinase 2
MPINFSDYPLILIEGLDGVGKSTQVQELSRILSAKVISTPQFIEDPVVPDKDLRIRMDSSPSAIRREYYRLSNFYASETARQLIVHSPVILDRYWCSTAAFSAIDDNPPRWEVIGEWPAGLLIPDIVFLLVVDEDNRNNRLSNRGEKLTEEEIRIEQDYENRQKVIEFYRCFNPIEIDTSNKTIQEVSKEILSWLRIAEIINEDFTSEEKLLQTKV